MTTTRIYSKSSNSRWAFPPWKHLNQDQRFREFVDFAGKDQGLAVTLRLSDDFQTLLRSKRDPMREISKRMNAELNKGDLQHLKIILMLEAERESGMLHLHGVFIPAGIDAKSIQRSLRQAAGYINGHSGSRQFLAKEIHDAHGWAKYIFKHRKVTRDLLKLADDRKLWWVSRSLNQATSDNYESLRKGRKPAANSASAPAYNVI